MARAADFDAWLRRQQLKRCRASAPLKRPAKKQRTAAPKTGEGTRDFKSQGFHIAFYNFVFRVQGLKTWKLLMVSDSCLARCPLFGQLGWCGAQIMSFTFVAGGLKHAA